jgi:hypothetical protein
VPLDFFDWLDRFEKDLSPSKVKLPVKGCDPLVLVAPVIPVTHWMWGFEVE